MVTLNFCTTCEGQKVRDVKHELERLFTQKVFSSIVCSICHGATPSSKSHAADATPEQCVGNIDSELHQSRMLDSSLKTECMKTEPSDIILDDDSDGKVLDGSLHTDENVALMEEDEPDIDGRRDSTEDGNDVDAEEMETGTEVVHVRATSDLKYINRLVDDARFRLAALRPELSKIAEIVNDCKLPFKCKLCKKSRKYNAINNLVFHLSSHLENKELSQKPYQCNRCCDRQFKNIRQWSQHVKIYQCRDPSCRKRFDSKLSFVAHEKFHSESDLRLFKCSYCNKGFLTSSVLSTHLRKMHPSPKTATVESKSIDTDVRSESKGSFVQVTAKEQLTALRPEIAKITEIVSDPKLPFKCRQCKIGNQFSSIEDLVDHISIHLSEEILQEPFQCSTCCNTRFTTLPKWYDHTGIYQCQYPSCHRRFDSKRSISEHSKKHSNHSEEEIKLFRCNKCRKTFVNEDNLLGHLRKSHTPLVVRPVTKEGHGEECDENQGYAKIQTGSHNTMSVEEQIEDVKIQKSSLRLEIRQLLKDNGASTTFMCLCKEAHFNTMQSFLTHAVTHSSISNFIDEPYQCNICCKKIFKYYREWRTHVKPHTCTMPNCDFRGPTRFRVNNHFTQVHSNAERKFRCSLCPKAFHRRYDLKIHVKVVHEKVKHFMCSFCGFQFFRESNLLNHERCHMNETPFHCDICGQAFLTETRLKIHKMDHTGEKPFICEQCGFSTKTKKDLQAHQQIHLEVRPFQCDICGMQTSKQSWLDIHKRKHTGEKIFKCRYCDEYFLYRDTRNSHEKRHPEWTGVRNHICNICGKDFQTNRKLQRHILIHTGDKPFHCLKCNFRTNHKSSLQEHQKIHDRDKTTLAPSGASAEQQPKCKAVSGASLRLSGNDFTGSDLQKSDGWVVVSL